MGRFNLTLGYNSSSPVTTFVFILFNTTGWTSLQPVVSLCLALIFHSFWRNKARTYKRTASIGAALTSINPLRGPTRKLREEEINDRIQFVRESLLDKRVNVNNLCGDTQSLPSGRPILNFASCSSPQ